MNKVVAYSIYLLVTYEETRWSILKGISKDRQDVLVYYPRYASVDLI